MIGCEINYIDGKIIVFTLGNSYGTKLSTMKGLIWVILLGPLKYIEMEILMINLVGY